jgi:selenocysteine lyase/cysteine desulfurase
LTSGEATRQGYDGNVAVTTEPKLDAHRLRADFAVFDELVNGKPVAFLDSAASTQKPRQVLDTMRDSTSTRTRTSIVASTGSSARRLDTRRRAPRWPDS